MSAASSLSADPHGAARLVIVDSDQMSGGSRPIKWKRRQFRHHFAIKQAERRHAIGDAEHMCRRATEGDK